MSAPPGSRSPFQSRLPRGRRGLPPEQVAESQRWRLLEAAGEALLACGYGGITSRRIARCAGVSSATFYRHFDDVDACLEAAHAMTVDSLWDLASSACRGNGTWPERLRAALDAATAFLVAEPALARLLCADVAVGVPGVAVARDRLLDRLAGLLCFGRGLRPAAADRLPPALEEHCAAASLGLLGDRVGGSAAGEIVSVSAELGDLFADLYADPAAG